MNGSFQYSRVLRSEGDIQPTVEEIVSVFAARGAGHDRQADLRTALTESCMNALEHGMISECEVRVVDVGQSIVVEVEDHGPPFTLTGTRPDMKERIEGKSRARGWGLYMIGQLADDCSVSRGREGNIVRMRFNVFTAQGGTRHG